jgi:hypothetical protein
VALILVVGHPKLVVVFVEILVVVVAVLLVLVLWHCLYFVVVVVENQHVAFHFLVLCFVEVINYFGKIVP